MTGAIKMSRMMMLGMLVRGVVSEHYLEHSRNDLDPGG